MFETLEPLAPDSILGVTIAYRRDTSPLKVDLGVGVYRDGSGNTPVPAAVREAERALIGARDHTRVTGFRVLHYALEGNHLHLIVEADDDTALSRGMKGLAIRLARGWNKAFARRGRVFADRYHARPVTSPTQMRNTLRYVLFNHVSHSVRDWQANRGQLRQRLRFFEPDRWSSGRWHPTKSGVWVIDGSPPPAGSPLSAPKTWLAREGWLRAGGPIDPAELLDRRTPIQRGER